MATYDIYLSRSGTVGIVGGGNISVAYARYDNQAHGTPTSTATEVDIEATTENQIWVVTAGDSAIRVNFETTVTLTTGWLIHPRQSVSFGANVGQKPSVILAA